MDQAIELAIAEDLGAELKDLTTDAIVAEDVSASGFVYLKEPGMVVGLQVMASIFRRFDDRIKLVRLVDDAASHLCRQFSHICPRMDAGFPVRHTILQTIVSRALIRDAIAKSRIYVDNRLQHTLNLRFNIPFFQRGQFPASVANGSQEIILPNPWAGRGNSAPFDQRMYNFRESSQLRG